MPDKSTKLFSCVTYHYSINILLWDTLSRYYKAAILDFQDGRHVKTYTYHYLGFQVTILVSKHTFSGARNAIKPFWKLPDNYLHKYGRHLGFPQWPPCKVYILKDLSERKDTITLLCISIVCQMRVQDCIHHGLEYTDIIAFSQTHLYLSI
jgi:hypothetical protein